MIRLIFIQDLVQNQLLTEDCRSGTRILPIENAFCNTIRNYKSCSGKVRIISVKGYSFFTVLSLIAIKVNVRLCF